jgi:anaerobic selenocysteine-containing dehydrogenase
MVWSTAESDCHAAPYKNVHEAFKKIEFWGSQEIFMTPTVSAYADIVLPVATFAEHDGVVIPHFGRNSAFVGAVNHCIERVGECKSDLEICFDLGKRLNPKAWPWETVSDFFTSRFSPNSITYPELQEKVVQQQKYIYKKYEKGLLRQDGEPGFETLTGLIELKATVFESWGEDPLPYFKEPPHSPYSTPELYAEYPLVLTTGGRKFTSFHSEHRQIPSLRQITPWPTLEIHPDTAADLGIQDGDWVGIENHLGKCRMKALVQPTVHPKVVHALHGWWYPEQDGEEPNLFGAFKSNINMLMPHKKIGKLGLGANYKSNLCKVYKVSGLDD